ncbi:MAG TPA: CarD family transcriptional regulator [Anaeromyxobacteraceae bacterium]|nr:CarD family transcriptional regulator [Anaeromyxobacteraceae bacterium]
MRGSPPRHPDEPKAELSALEGIIQDASELQVGDRLVYPNQGVCSVVGVEVKEIAGQRLELVHMRREEDGASVLVPKGKVPSVGLRRVASGELMEGVFHYLAAQYDDPELDWKVRHRDNADRLVAGGVLGVAEVVKGLHALSRIRPLPTKEREQYDNARHLLVNEVSVSLGVPPGLAEDFVDYALMPPAGTTFELKPPPKPILMPNRPRRRRAVAEEEGDGLEGLGLEDLGIDLGAEEGEAAEGEAAEGEAKAEGEAAEAAPAPEAEAEAPKKAAGKKAEKPARAEKPAPAAKKAAKAEKAEKKPAAKKPAAKPARAPAAKKAAAGKAGGKKK